MIIALILSVVLIASQAEFFFTSRNMFNIGQNMAVVGLLAVGMTLVIVSARLDVSGRLHRGLCVSRLRAYGQSGWPRGGRIGAGVAIGLVRGRRGRPDRP